MINPISLFCKFHLSVAINNIDLKTLPQSLENHSKTTKLMLVVEIKPKQSFKKHLATELLSKNDDNLADKLFLNFY